jgi:anti-sigma regulatory factor (Ser/Thr protein kinase)
MFATVFFGVLDTASGALAHVNAGHDAPVLLGPAGVKARLGRTGVAVGLEPNFSYEIGAVCLEPGDALFAYTDGVTEARDPAGLLFTEKRLLAILEKPLGSAADLVGNIKAGLDSHGAGAAPCDDVTMLAVRRRPFMQSTSLTVPATLDALSDISDFVLAAADAAGIHGQARYRLRLAVDEIATNIVTHGYPADRSDGGAPKTIDLHAETDDKTLKVILEDGGMAFDPRQVSPPADLQAPLEQRQIGGLGVYLALTGVDQFSYERAGDRNRNVLVVNRS